MRQGPSGPFPFPALDSVVSVSHAQLSCAGCAGCYLGVVAKTLTTFAELLRPYYTTSGPPAPPEPWLVELRRQQALPLAERSTDYLQERIRDARKSYYSWCEREEAEETAAELARRGNPIGEGDLP